MTSLEQLKSGMDKLGSNSNLVCIEYSRALDIGLEGRKLGTLLENKVDLKPNL